MRTVSSIIHTTVAIAGGGEVIILNPDAIIDAEATAMLQALHSRSVGGLRAHLQVLAEKGADNFMANFYVGYGHASIGDCGTTAIFIEGVSMLAAKAIQDWRLYSGQEASTRYIDFAKQPFIDPLKTATSHAILEAWRTFYVSAMPELVADLKIRFPMQAEEKEKMYNKAIDARAFDILRGFLPAGASTNLAWSTNLRQAADKIKLLRHHPLDEVKHIAAALEEALQKAHPHSFGHKRYEGTEHYNETSMKHYYYHHASSPEFALTRNTLNMAELKSYATLLETRPIHTELPIFMEDTGELQFEFLLDFGSFRDLQRHRAIVQRMPLLTSELGFESWYLQELPIALRTKAQNLLDAQLKAIAGLHIDTTTMQYFLPMGYRCACKITGNLRALVYMVELRATRFVHHTLRQVAKNMMSTIAEICKPVGLTVHMDSESDRFDSKRGAHDIEIR